MDFATGSLTDMDAKGVKGFNMSTGSYLAEGHTSLLPQFTQIKGSNLRFYYTASTAPVVASTASIEWQKQPVDNARGDFEAGSSTAVPNANSSTEIVIPEINVSMRSEAIVAKTKKLKASWTPEFAQDLNAYHSLDAEAELTSMLSEYIALSIVTGKH